MRVSLPRSLSFCQSWRSAPPLRWFGPYISTIATESGCADVADKTSGPGPAGCTTVSRGHHESAPVHRPDCALERHLQGGGADDQDHQRADEPAHRQPQQRAGRHHGADDEGGSARRPAAAPTTTAASVRAARGPTP